MEKAGSKLVVVDFFARWCNPCKFMAPKMEEYDRQYAGKIETLMVDVDILKEFAEGKYGATSLPLFVFLKNGKVVQKFSGADYSRVLQIIHTYM